MTIYDAVVKCKGDYSLRNIMSIYAKEFSTAPLKVINTLSKNLYKFISIFSIALIFRYVKGERKYVRK